MTRYLPDAVLRPEDEMVNKMSCKICHWIIACICCCALCLPAMAGDPGIAFLPPGQYPAGGIVVINGTTNLAPGDHLAVEVYSSTFGPTPKTGNGTFYGASGIVTVQPGQPGSNVWSFPVNTSGFPPDMYVVIVTGIEVQVTGSTTFTLVSALTTTATTVPYMTTFPPSTPPASAIASPSPSPTTTQAGGISGTVCLAGICAAFVLMATRTRKYP